MRCFKESSFYKMEDARKSVSLPLSTNRGYALMEGARELAEACLSLSVPGCRLLCSFVLQSIRNSLNWALEA